MFGKKDIQPIEEKVSKQKDKKAQPKEKINRIVKIQEYIDVNRKKVITISIAIVAATVLFFVIKAVIEKKSDENQQLASASLSRILPYYTANDYNKALNGDPRVTVRGQKVIGLIDIVQEYGGTNQGKVAALYAGNCYLSMNKGSDALKYFDKATGSSSKLIMMGGYAGLGAANELAGNFNEAVKNYEKAVELSDSQDAKIRYLYYCGLCYEKIGNKESAEKKFREVIGESEFSDFAKYAKMGLTRLGTIIE